MPRHVNSGVSHLSMAGEKPLSKPFGTTEDKAMEDLEDLEMEDLGPEDKKALGLRIERCVDEVLRSHLVERPLNTTKNYLPKQKEWKVS
jgi:hypothetical protein